MLFVKTHFAVGRKGEQMSDLIDRQTAMDALVKQTHLPWEDLRTLYPMLEVLEQIPSAEPKRRKGRWLIEYLDGIPGRRAEIKYCSECCQVSPCRHNFCPNCGADMRGE